VREIASLTAASLFERFGTSPAGLTGDEARRRLAEYGANEPAPGRRSAAIGRLVGALTNPLVAILLTASLVSELLGEGVNATIIVVIVALSIVLNLVQTHRSERAADRLRQETAPTATVLRDERWEEVPRRTVVPGDLVRLTAGDRVPADARLVEARDLHVQQAALTGESLPAAKQAGELATPPADVADAENLVFLGSSVVSGVGVAVVVATGAATAFGDIAARLGARPPETEFERGVRHFALLIMRTVIFLVLFVVVISLALQRPPMQSLLFAVALAVGLTPEFLPMIMTVTLARGAVHMARREVIVKHLAAIEDFGSMDILCSDKTGTLTSGQMVLDRALDPEGRPAERPFLLAYLNSRHETGTPSPLDAAILAHGQPDVAAYRKLDEIPFDFDRRRVSVVVEGPSGRLLIAKGAPESLVTVCDLDPSARARSVAVSDELSAAGYRVLAVAYSPVPAQPTYTVADEEHLVLAGFVAFVDPPLPEVADALRALARDGVRVKILTGDNELVTRHVCAQVGIDGAGIVLGRDLERMNDAALAVVAEETSVFARVSPAQKYRIVLALKSRGHVVGFLGDGINDAPSLHAADVGVSVVNAVDVAKEAADIILRQRTLTVLHEGVLTGRQAFANVMKYLLMGTSSNFGNMASMAVAVPFLPFLPMLPTQILLNNFLYDLAQITIPTDNVDPSMMAKPRRWDIRTLRDFMLVIGPISSLYDVLTFLVLLTVFHASEAFFRTGWFLESLATQTLVLFVIRTAGNPLRSRPSRPLVATTLLIVLVALLLPFSPFAPMLGFVPLPAAYFGFLVPATLTYLALVEIVKRPLMRRFAG
jgi:Mg2+-importing ATPase